MTARKRGRPASLPDGPYRRPNHFDPESLTVRVFGEDGVDLGEYRFSDLGGPYELLAALVKGFAMAAAPGGRWHTKSTLRGTNSRLRLFYREILHLYPDITSIQDITPEVWNRWRQHSDAKNSWSGTVNSVRVILRLSPGLRDDTRQALHFRTRDPSRRTVVHAYTREEYSAIERAAWRIVGKAEDRIRSHQSELKRYRSAKASGAEIGDMLALKGEMLEALANSGQIPRIPKANRIKAKAALRDTCPSLWHGLFLQLHEAFAFMVLLVMMRGYNPDTVNNLTTDHQRPDGGATKTHVMNVELSKPRASLERKRTSDNLVGRSRSSAAGLVRLAIELTAPAREALRLSGHPTNRLFVCRLSSPWPRNGPFHLGDFRTLATRYWFNEQLVTNNKGEPIRVTLQRVRLTEQVLNRKPRMNSLDVHDSQYVMREPSVAKASEDVIVAGQSEALQSARSISRVITLSQDQIEQARHDPLKTSMELGLDPIVLADLLAGRLDTPIAACGDFGHSPFSAGGPCTASFLMCLGCQNAIAAPVHLPRLVCLRDALTNIASVVTDRVWKLDYAAHYERLNDLISMLASSSEAAQARHKVTQEQRESIEALLQRRLDA